MESRSGGAKFGGATFVGAKEIQRRLGVSRQRVQQLMTRPDWPAPYEVLSMGKIWLHEDVEAWIARHRPDLPPPGKSEGSR